MADEFVDFYEALNLSPEAERKEIHRRISELYLESQRNLEHRDFQKRVKYQEMFETVLPRARYILLDATRREDYDRLVRAFRGISEPEPVPEAQPEPAFGAGDASSFRLAEDAHAHRPSGKAPRVEALPKPALNAAQMAEQRDEMWAKWKAGLEAAIAHDETEPLSDKPAPRPVSAPSPVTRIETSTEAPAPRKPRAQASSILFNFGDNSSNAFDEEESARLTAFDIELQKTERKRAVMKEILDSVGLKGTLIGGLGTAIPLGALLITGMGHYYPRGGAPLLAMSSSLAWTLGIAIVLGATLFAASEMSKSMRRQASMELSMLPVEELLRKVGRSY